MVKYGIDIYIVVDPSPPAFLSRRASHEAVRHSIWMTNHPRLKKCSCAHTRTHSFMAESRNLLNNAGVVESLLREVDPAFVTCFRYEDMADEDQASRVASFVAPTEYAAQRLADKMLGAVRVSSPPGAGRLLESLQQKVCTG